MESFYGGRQGASFVIKKRFDAISLSETVYRRRYYARQPGEGNVNEGPPIWPLIERNGLVADDAYTWGLYTLDGSPIDTGSPYNFPTEVAEGMVEFFSQGAATTSEVNYGEFVIIDTVSGLQDSQSIHNGKIFVRTPDINNGFGGAVQIGQITGMTYVDTVQISWDNVLNKPNNLVQDGSYHHTDLNYTQVDKTKLDGIAAGAEVNVQPDWSQSDNSADDFIKNKPTNLSDFTNDLDLIDNDMASLTKTYSSSKINNLLNQKVTGQYGKGLSTNDYTNEEKTKLAGIEAGAQVNVQPDWDQDDTSADDYIKNKPNLIELDDTQPRSDTTYSSVKIEGMINNIIVPLTQVEYDNLPVVEPGVNYIIIRQVEGENDG